MRQLPRRLPLAIGLTVFLAGPALAQAPKPQGQNLNSQSLQQQVNQNLQQAGFTDIKIMPESFLVRAKDKSGHPVMMIINPDSVTAVTEYNGSVGAAPGSTNSTGAK